MWGTVLDAVAVVGFIVFWIVFGQWLIYDVFKLRKKRPHP